MSDQQAPISATLFIYCIALAIYAYFSGPLDATRLLLMALWSLIWLMIETIAEGIKNGYRRSLGRRD